MFRWLHVMALVCAGMGMFPAVAAADVTAEVAALLNEGWDNSPEGLAAAERRYEGFASGAAADAAIDYAMALVRLKHRKYEPALAALEAATTRRPGHLAAWRAKMWLLVYLRQHEAALAEIQSLANIYPAGEKSPEVEADLADTARWMGRLHGHLTWAAAGSRPAMQAHTAAVIAKLSGARLAAFEQGREEVRKSFEAAQADFDKIKAEDDADEQKRRELAKETNARERQRIDAERTVLQSEGMAAKAKADGEIEEINAKLAPLQKEYAEIERKAAPIQRDVRDLRRRADQKDSDARREKDNNRKRDLERDADRLRDDARREERRLDPLEREADRVKREAAKLEGERARVLGAFQAIASAINQKLAVLLRDEKVVEKSERSLLQPPGPSPRQTALQSKIAAVSTYQRLPLEEERTRLLDGK